MRPALLSLAFAAALALAPAADDGYKPLFNGKDLSGWVNVNTAPSTFYVKDGEIITTGTPTGYLRTDRQYENFELEMEWMHVNKTEVGNSGLFVWGDPIPAVGTGYTRGIEVQVLVNLEYKDKKTGAVTATSHGDLFSIWGASCVPDRPHPLGWERCLPSENRAKGGGEWNHYKVVANGGVIKLHVNGKEVSGGSKCVPRKGYLALESEGAECHFKNLRIKELPSTNPKPEETARVWEGHKSLFTGLDLAGWKTEKDAWKAANGGKLVSTGGRELVSEKAYGACELIFDCKLPAKGGGRCEVAVGAVTLGFLPGGDGVVSVSGDQGRSGVGTKGAATGKAGSWNRVVITVKPDRVSATIDGKPLVPPRGEGQAPRPGPITFKPAGGLEIMNVFVRELK